MSMKGSIHSGGGRKVDTFLDRGLAKPEEVLDAVNGKGRDPPWLLRGGKGIATNRGII